MMNKEKSIKKSIWVKLGILSIVLLLVGSALVTSLSHTVDYSNASYWTDDRHSRIVNSNGNYWAVGSDETTLQVAIDDLSDGGWVEIPSDTTVSATASITLDDNMELRGAGNSSKIVLASASNCDVIRVISKENVKISNLHIDGNGLGQTFDKTYEGIHAEQCNNLVIEDCYITNTSSAGIFNLFSNSTTIKGCIVKNTNPASGYDAGASWRPVGIHVTSSIDVSVLNCDVSHCYSVGISFESWLTGNLRSKNFLIDGCYCYDNYIGIGVEQSEDGIITNCFTYNNTRDTTAYATLEPVGILVHTGTLGSDNITISNCVSYHNGLQTDADKYEGNRGISLTADNSKILGCTVYNNSGYGISAGDNATISDCTVLNNDDIGIYYYGQNPIITGNRVEHHIKGIYLSDASPTTNMNGDVSHNTIRYVYGSSNVHGIECSLAWVTLGLNEIEFVQHYGLYITGKNVSAIGNKIKTCSLDGIKVADTYHCTVSSNNIADDCSEGIEIDDSFFCAVGINIAPSGISETGAADYNSFVGNICYPDTCHANITGNSVETGSIE